MARIRCTIVETSYSTGLERLTGPAGHADPVAQPARDRSHGEFESPEPMYCDLLPWADPYIASLVQELHVATGALLPHAWPRGAAPELGSNASPRRRDQRWPQRYRSEGER